MSRLLNESWIEGLPDNIVENLEELNRYVVRRICERIKEIGDIGTSDSHRLKSAIEYAGADLDAIEKEISKIMSMNRAEVQRLFEEVAAENISFANTYYAARGMEELQTYRSRANLTAFVEAAKRTAMEGTANLSHTHTVGFKRGRRVVPLQEYYITAIDRAVTFVQTGTVDYQTAMRSTVRDMARSGLRRVTFDSGYSRRLDSQARMNILEGVRRLNADMMEETGKEFGADGVEISAHGLCAPDHQPIQGRQFSNREYERLNGRLQRPIGTLNCHHFPTPIILGVSKPVHSARELEEINARSNAPVEYRGHTMTRYEASQKQRQLETAIRYAKDERDACVAAGDKIGAAQARKRSAALGREYRSFCEQAGLTPRPERTRSMTGPAVERAPKNLEKTARSGIIGPDIKPGGGSGVQTIGKIDIEKFKSVSSNIRTNEVVITDERIEHIKERHPNDFERYSGYISIMLSQPQYILEDPVPDTAVILQEFSENSEHFRLILKLAVTESEQGKKNSVITFLKISEKKFRKYLRNKKILYKPE